MEDQTFLPWLLVEASTPRLEVISTFLHEYKVQCDYDRLGRDLLQLRDGAMHTIRSREIRGNEDDAPFTSTAHVSANVNEKLSRAASV